MSSLPPTQAPGERSPAAKFAFVLLVGFLLTIPLFSVWLLVYDRQQQSEFAQASIAEGWAGPQVVSGPILVIPYRANVAETVTEGGQQVTRSRLVWRELSLAPERVRIETNLSPERRARSIYEVVVYEASMDGQAVFAMPDDLARFGVTLEDLDLARAELRFGLSDPRGIAADPDIRVGGRRLRLQPGGGGRSGFFAWIDGGSLAAQPMAVAFRFGFRGNRMLALAPQAGDTLWRVNSPWPHPSFQGSFLPVSREAGDDGFAAAWRIGHLALGQSLVTTSDAGAAPAPVEMVPQDPYMVERSMAGPAPDRPVAQVSLIQPVDLYSRVDRSAKYGFLFIGFTFLAFLLFDIIGGVRVSAVEYLLVGAGLVLFFVLLLALAEMIGFGWAYVVAAAAITGLNTAYSAAVLKSWRRAAAIGILLGALYALLYVLLSLEAYSLLIGSLLLFVALAAVMYLTRNLNWGARLAAPVPGAAS